MSTPQPQKKMKAFKSPKELVVLAVVALAFIGIVYKMYFTKKKPAAPARAAAESPANAPADPAAGDAAAVAAKPDAAPAANPPEVTLAKAAPADNSPLQPPAPPPLPHSPFLGKDLRAKIYPATAEIKILEPAADLVVAPADLPAALAKLPGAEQAAAKGITLEGILITADWRAAIINGETVPLGQSILGLTVSSILNDRITLEIGSRRIVLLIQPPVQMRRDTHPGPKELRGTQ